MELTFVNFWQDIISNPMLFITVLLTLGVIFVNGCFWHGHEGANTLSGQKATLSSGGKRLKRIFPEISGRKLS